MTDVEERLHAYATAVLAEVPPVTAAEARARRSRRGLRRVLAVAAVMLALAGTAAALAVDDKEDTPNVVTAGRSSHPLTLDGHRDWQVAVLNGEIDPSDDELAARYTEGFLAAVPPATFRSGGASLVTMAPWRVLAEIERRGDEVLAVQLASKDGQQVRLTLHRAPDGRLDATTILAAEPCAEPTSRDTDLDPPLRDALAWTNELLASTRVPSDEELRQRLAPSFLTAVPTELFRAGLPKLRELGPYTTRSFEGPPLSRSLVARVGVRTGEEARLTLAVEPNAPHRITTLAVFTQAPCRMTSSG